MKGVLSQMLRKCFSQKMETFSPLGNVSIGKRGNVHLVICKAKLFLTVIFQIYRG